MAVADKYIILIVGWHYDFRSVIHLRLDLAGFSFPLYYSGTTFSIPTLLYTSIFHRFLFCNSRIKKIEMQKITTRKSHDIALACPIWKNCRPLL